VKKLLVASLLILVSSVCLAAESYDFTASNNKVTFTAIGKPGFLRINGAGVAAEGKLLAEGGKVSGDLTVKLADLVTGIELRDRHLKEKYLQVDKYPTAKLTLKDVAYVQAKPGVADGVLTIKDQAKPVKVDFTLAGKDLVAKIKLSIKDYPAIGVPSYLGVTVADEVEVSIHASL